MVAFQQRSLLAEQRSRVTAQVDAVALALSENRPIESEIRPGIGVQITDRSGRVLTASEGLRGQPAVSNTRPPIGVHLSVPLAAKDLGGEDGVNVIEATTVRLRTGGVTIYAVAFGSQLDRSTRAILISLGIALPLIVLLTGGLAWVLTGLALRPVESMRTKVADLAQDRLEERVPIPPGDDEVRRLALTLNDLLERLEIAQKRQRSFVSDASHELRSPIASMLATIEVAEAHPDRADLQRVIEVLGAESRRLSGLVDDLLLLAAHEERPGVVSQVPVDLEEILFAESDRLRLQGGLSISVAGVTAVRVLGDPRSLERAVRNLVDNAVRHASNTIALTLEADGFEAVLRVADDGDGVDPATAERLFERFTRSAEARDRPTGGAGLGLSIVAAVAAAHGGSVAFVPAPSGTVIELRLPLSPEIAGGETTGSSPRIS